MAAAGAFLVVVLLLGLALPIGLWLLVERETADQQVVDRDEAVRTVRHDDGPEDRWGR